MNSITVLLDSIRESKLEEEARKVALTETNNTEEESVATESFTQDAPPPAVGKQPYQMFQTPVEINSDNEAFKFNIILNQFNNPKSQIAIEQLLVSASPDATITIDFSQVDGNIYSNLSIAAAIKASKAKTIGIFTSIDCIDAVIMWLACKEHRVASIPFMVLEGIKYGNQGSVVDQLIDSESSIFMQTDLLNELVNNKILTPEEAASFSKHETVFILFGDALRARLLPLTSDTKMIE